MVKLDTLVIIIGVALISTIIILSVCYYVFENFKYNFFVKFKRTTTSTSIKPSDSIHLLNTTTIMDSH